MSFIRTIVQRHVGRRWSAALGQTLNWWGIPPLADEIERRIADGAGRGVVDLVRAATGGAPLASGVSIGAGFGDKERKLLAAGLVDHFTLYELAESGAAEARAMAEAEGLADRQTMIVGDAFAAPPEPIHDLVYWDHALHHMMDVDAALAWSVGALRPGGLLVVNDYVGPKRLQFPRDQIETARGFLRAHADVLGDVAGDVRLRTPITHARQYLRDPSEAPQSELIEAAWTRNTGTPMRRIGGVLIHLCAPAVCRAVGPDHPIYDDLIAADAALAADGPSHFAVGLWRKPEDA